MSLTGHGLELREWGNWGSVCKSWHILFLTLLTDPYSYSPRCRMAGSSPAILAAHQAQLSNRPARRKDFPRIAEIRDRLIVVMPAAARHIVQSHRADLPPNCAHHSRCRHVSYSSPLPIPVAETSAKNRRTSLPMAVAESTEAPLRCNIHYL